MTHSCPTRRSSDLILASLAPAFDAQRTNKKLHQDASQQHLEVFSLNFEASKALKSHRNGFRVDSRNDQVASFSGLKLATRSEEHTSELQSLMRISYAVFCLKKKKHNYKPAN